MTTIAAKVAHVRAQMSASHRPHRCHAIGCSTDVPPALFMCAPHWRMVPAWLRDRIWATYSPGQEDGDAPVTRAYLDAHHAATAAVAEAEGRATAAQRSDAVRAAFDAEVETAKRQIERHGFLDTPGGRLAVPVRLKPRAPEDASGQLVMREQEPR